MQIFIHIKKWQESLKNLSLVCWLVHFYCLFFVYLLNKHTSKMHICLSFVCWFTLQDGQDIQSFYPTTQDSFFEKAMLGGASKKLLMKIRNNFVEPKGEDYDFHSSDTVSAFIFWFVWVCICICVCVYTCVSVCACVCMCVCVVCLCVCVYVCGRLFFFFYVFFFF